MEIKNNKDEVPFQHYLQQFQQLDPEDAVRRLELPFDGNAFTLRFLNETYAVTWPEYAISSGDPNAFALGRLQAQTFLLRYLLVGGGRLENLPAAALGRGVPPALQRQVHPAQRIHLRPGPEQIRGRKPQAGRGGNQPGRPGL